MDYKWNQNNNDLYKTIDDIFDKLLIEDEEYKKKKGLGNSYFQFLRKEKKLNISWATEGDEPMNDQLFNSPIMDRNGEFIVVGPIGWYGLDHPRVHLSYSGIRKFARLLCCPSIAFPRIA
jgi:hypothetical protein